MENLHLALPLEWLLEGPWIIVLAKCWLICPGVPQLLGVIFESRWIPWNPRYQFTAFVPGNFFLGAFIAAASTVIHETPEGSILNSQLLSQSVLLGCFGLYVALNVMDVKSNYTRAQMASAAKIWHNALYFWYSYVGVMMFLVVILVPGVSWIDRLIILSLGVVWLAMLAADNLVSEETAKRRFTFAHVANFPIWKNGWRLRKRNEHGYS